MAGGDPGRLVRAADDEDFDTVAHGEPAAERPKPAEVIWRDDTGVTCRQWNWRQCTRTRMTPATTNAVLVVTHIAQVMLGEHARAVRCHAAWILASDAMASGNPHGAHSWLCQLGDSERFSILPLYPADITDEPRLVHIAPTVKDHALAAHVGNLSEERAALNPENTSLAAVAAHTRGLLRRKRSDLASAADLFMLGNRPLAAAAAFEDFGVQALDDRDTEAAIAAFNRSLAIFTDASATWDAARLRGRLQALGVRRRLARSPRHTTGWESLTDTEVAVARLVAEGLSNRDVASRLVISHRTVR